MTETTEPQSNLLYLHRAARTAAAWGRTRARPCPCRCCSWWRPSRPARRWGPARTRRRPRAAAAGPEGRSSRSGAGTRRDTREARRPSWWRQRAGVVGSWGGCGGGVRAGAQAARRARGSAAPAVVALRRTGWGRARRQTAQTGRRVGGAKGVYPVLLLCGVWMDRLWACGDMGLPHCPPAHGPTWQRSRVVDGHRSRAIWACLSIRFLWCVESPTLNFYLHAMIKKVGAQIKTQLQLTVTLSC